MIVLSSLALITAHRWDTLTIHAQDLAAEWLSVRAAVDGLPLSSTVEELARHYDVDHLARYPFYFEPTSDPSTPAQLLMNLPLLAVPFEGLSAAAAVWTLVTGIGFAYAISRLGVRWYWAALGLAVLLLSYPGLEQLRHGQFSFLVAGLLALTWALARQGDSPIAGVPLGIAVGVKLYIWLVVPALWLAGRRRAAVSAAITGTVLNLAGWAAFDLESSDLLALAGRTASDRGNMTINGSLVGMFDLPTVALLGLSLLALFWLRKRTLDQTLVFAVPLSLLLSPIVWAHYLPVLLVGVVARRRWRLLGPLAILWFLTPQSGRMIGIVTFISLVVALAGEYVLELVDRRRDPATGAGSVASDPRDYRQPSIIDAARDRDHEEP